MAQGTIALEISVEALEVLLRRGELHLEQVNGLDAEAHRALCRLAVRSCICTPLQSR